jgi:dehydrogenase/reductase SDR family member 9
LDLFSFVQIFFFILLKKYFKPKLRSIMINQLSSSQDAILVNSNSPFSSHNLFLISALASVSLCLVSLCLLSCIGFGEALSKVLSKKGFRVIATCLTKDGAEKLKKEVALTVICNITKPTDISHLSDQVEQYCHREGAKVWALVNNAGIADGGALDWTSLDVYRRVMEVNFFGLVATTKAILPFLKHNPGSRIVNLSSVAGLVSGAGIGPYFASKHAVEGLAKGLREELKPWKIHVSNVNPSFMRTPILTSGMNSAKSAFESAPKDITSQYDPSFQDAHVNLMNRASEDPALVIDVLVEAITDKYPVMWYFPGYGSNLLRFALCLSLS